MKRPSFQFYPADWTGNANLRRCTHAEKGVWIDVMCLMHDAPEYGVLRWTLAEIARAVGTPIHVLKKLHDKGVLKGVEDGDCEPMIYTPRSGGKVGAPVTLIRPQTGPIWYSSRMVCDEYIRGKRGDGTRFAARDIEPPKATPKPVPKVPPKPPFGDGPTSTSTSTSSMNTDTPKRVAFGDDGFSRFWQKYPKKVDKKSARTAFAKLQPDETLLVSMLVSLQRMSVSRDWQKDAGRYIPYPATWLNGRRWEDEGPNTLPDDANAPWAVNAGFTDRFDAESSGCYEHNASDFCGGKRIKSTACAQ